MKQNLWFISFAIIVNSIEEAMAFEQLMERFGYNQQTIADTIGKSRAYVANTLRLLTLPQEVQDTAINAAQKAAAINLLVTDIILTP